jgi:protein-S-isoprenylcysteine O-methyltransferase Ste14
VRIIGFGHVVVGVLDNRFAWTPVPSSLRGAGLLVLVAGFALFIRAMRTNRFFSAVVRIQSDRGHHVVDVGPYARVRHPGYAAMILAIPGSGLALGSWLAFGIGLVYSALILRRVRFEDGFLRAHLEGYGEYAQRVRYRLVPGLW